MRRKLPSCSDSTSRSSVSKRCPARTKAATQASIEATTHYLDADVLARVSSGLGEAMVGISTQSLDPSQLLETRGW